MSEPPAAPAPKQGPSHRTLALIVASATFMEQLDGTILATALPRMAETFGVPPQVRDQC